MALLKHSSEFSPNFETPFHNPSDLLEVVLDSKPPATSTCPSQSRAGLVVANFETRVYRIEHYLWSN